MRKALCVASACLLAVLPGGAGVLRAASTDFELLEPTAGGELGLAVESARVGSPGWRVGSLLQYEQEPVRFNGAAVGGAGSGVDARVQGRLLVARQLADRVLLTLDAPVVLYERQDLFAGQTAGFNDLRFGGRVNLLDLEPFALGLGLQLALPTGDPDVFGGSDFRALQPAFSLLGESTLGLATLRLAVAYRERDDTDLPAFGLSLRDRVDLGGAVAIAVNEAIGLFGEVVQRWQVSGSSALSGMAEAFVGAQARFGNWSIKPALGLALTSGYGQPGVRALLGVGYQLGGAVTPAEAPPPPPIQGRVSVSVKDDKGQALAGVDLTLLSAGQTVAAATSDASGRAELAATPGAYVLRASLAAFESLEVQLQLTEGVAAVKEVALTPRATQIPCAPTDNNCKLQWWYEQNRNRK